MFHPLKIFFKVIHDRIHSKCKESFTKLQFEFRNGFVTREEIFGLNMLVQRCRHFCLHVFDCRIDFRNDFDWVEGYPPKRKFILASESCSQYSC